MIHWLSDYNYDFALASIPVQLLIILFYSFRRNLPIRSSHCFLAVMISNLTMTLADIVSCEMNEVWTSYFSIIVILIIFFSAENPDLFYDRRIGLFNKYAFALICDDFLEKNIPVSAIMVSAHDFDTAKHLYGANQIQRQLELVSKRIKGITPKTNIFYLGGGRFIILSRENADTPELTARKWKRQFERQLKLSDETVPMTFTVMLIPFDILKREIERIEELINFASGRSYHENQRGNYAITEAILSKLQREKDIEAALKKALEQHRVEVFFQPIYSTGADRVVGAEALARLNDDNMGYIPPNEFIRVAERNGDITELGRQIFDRVCRFVNNENVVNQGIEFINVNLSPAQCLDDDLAADLSGIAFKHGVPMNMFDFEITESFIDDHQAIVNQMTRLQASGAELSLDDFGTGTSNIAQLLKLPIHVVKLDMSVVHSYFKGESKLLPDLIQMFRNSNMKIVVEGVETVDMKTQLAEMGCDYEQGYFFSKPVPPSAFLAYLRATR